MKLELLDAYHIRARLCPSIILLSPIAITIFMCFGEIANFVTSSIIIFILLAFTNYIPILQRRIYDGKSFYNNYAAEFLYPDDSNIDKSTKLRYYNKLAQLDKSFSAFSSPDSSDDFKACCQSAIIYLRTHTRNNRLLLEDNINLGFCKNLLASKPIGITLSLVCAAIAAGYSWIQYRDWFVIPLSNYFAFGFDLLITVFFICGITKSVMRNTAKHYARTLLYTIDTLDVESK